jgi:hypothetical protein
MRYALIALLLTGCAGQQIQHDAYVERLEQTCEAMGHQRNTEAGVQCGLRLHAQLQANGGSAPAPYRSFRNQQGPIVTSCNRAGGNTTCYTQ